MVCAVRLSIKQCSLTQQSALLSPLANALTAFAFDLLLAQFTLAVNYQSAPDQNEEGKYQVTVSSSGRSNLAPSSDALRPVIGEDGMITSWRCQEDFGLAEAHECPGHQTDLYSCTCQFPIVFQLPCRHILHLHIVHQVLPLKFQCSKFWHVQLMTLRRPAIWTVAF